MGYVVFRGAQEMVMYLATALGWLLLIALSGQPDAAPLAGLVRTVETVAWDQLLAIPFALGAVAARAAVAVGLGAPVRPA